MKWWLTLVFVCCFGHAINAQEPVSTVPDVASWPIAFANSAIAATDAIRGPHAKCGLARLALSAGIENGVALTLKHFVVSPRPCLGCASNGWPSGHEGQSLVGFSNHWQIGLGFGLVTGALRVQANRHTKWQVLAGAVVGIGSEALGKVIKCD